VRAATCEVSATGVGSSATAMCAPCHCRRCRRKRNGETGRA
jgi:hypothetical protein